MGRKRGLPVGTLGSRLGSHAIHARRTVNRPSKIAFLAQPFRGLVRGSSYQYFFAMLEFSKF